MQSLSNKIIHSGISQKHPLAIKAWLNKYLGFLGYHFFVDSNSTETIISIMGQEAANQKLIEFISRRLFLNQKTTVIIKSYNMERRLYWVKRLDSEAQYRPQQITQHRHDPATQQFLAPINNSSTSSHTPSRNVPMQQMQRQFQQAPRPRKNTRSLRKFMNNGSPIKQESLPRRMPINLSPMEREIASSVSARNLLHSQKNSFDTLLNELKYLIKPNHWSSILTYLSLGLVAYVVLKIIDFLI